MANIIFTRFNAAESVHETLLDIILPFVYAVRDLGHHAGVSKSEVSLDGLNVITEYFEDQHVDFLLKSNVRYAIIQTELMTGNTFNYDDVFRSRFRNFQRVCQRAEFVINLVGETQVPCPSFRCEPGWHPALDHPLNLDLARADFMFFGSASNRRSNMLAEIAKADPSKKTLSGDTLNFLDRNYFLQNARWSLGLKAHWQGLDCVSLSRTAASLHCMRPVIHERVSPGPGIGNIPLIHDNEEDFASYCARLADEEEFWLSELDRQTSEFRMFPVTEMLADGLGRAGIKL